MFLQRIVDINNTVCTIHPHLWSTIKLITYLCQPIINFAPVKIKLNRLKLMKKAAGMIKKLPSTMLVFACIPDGLVFKAALKTTKLQPVTVKNNAYY